MAKCKNCKYLDTVQNDLRSEPFKWCVCTDDSPVLDMERDCDYYAPMTNADRIRSFSDDELAEFIEQVSTDSMETISFGTKEYEEIWEHKETALQWLQSEVRNNNEDSNNRTY